MKELPQYTKYHILYTSAYTLIELLVGLTIIGILFGFGYAGFRDFSRRESISGSSKKVQGDLRLAQSMALNGQKPPPPNDVPCRSPNLLDSYSFKVISATEYKIEANCGSSTVTVKDVEFSLDVTISTPSPNPIKFKVLGDGTNITEGSVASITLTQVGTNNTVTVTVGAGGEIY